jgi:hypothetical protein
MPNVDERKQAIEPIAICLQRSGKFLPLRALLWEEFYPFAGWIEFLTGRKAGLLRYYGTSGLVV